MEIIFSGFEQRIVRAGIPFFARIYGGNKAPSEGFNVCNIRLDAGEHSSLKWEFEAPDSLILWELDFSLDLEIVEDEFRYLALELAVDHFTKTVWPLYEERTFGVALYRGPFLKPLLDPLKQLASRLPEVVRPFVFFDTDPILDAETYFRSINQDTLGFLTPILKGKMPQAYPYAFPALAWDHPHSSLGIFSDTHFPSFPERPLPVAILIPESGEFPVFEGPVRMIPEQILTHEWEGIDHLIAVSSSVSDRCRRKLRGFQAAGGDVIFIDSPDDEAWLRLPEISRLFCPAASR